MPSFWVYQNQSFLQKPALALSYPPLCFHALLLQHKPPVQNGCSLGLQVVFINPSLLHNQTQTYSWNVTPGFQENPIKQIWFSIMSHSHMHFIKLMNALPQTLFRKKKYSNNAWMFWKKLHLQEKIICMDYSLSAGKLRHDNKPSKHSVLEFICCICFWNTPWNSPCPFWQPVSEGRQSVGRLSLPGGRGWEGEWSIKRKRSF